MCDLAVPSLSGRLCFQSRGVSVLRVCLSVGAAVFRIVGWSVRRPNYSPRHTVLSLGGRSVDLVRRASTEVSFTVRLQLSGLRHTKHADSLYSRLMYWSSLSDDFDVV